MNISLISIINKFSPPINVNSGNKADYRYTGMPIDKTTFSGNTKPQLPVKEVEDLLKDAHERINAKEKSEDKKKGFLKYQRKSRNAV